MQRIKKLFAFVLVLLSCVAFMGGCKSKTKKTYTLKERQQFEENLIRANRALVAQDQDEIKVYTDKRNWDMQKSKTGLWYEIIKTGNGEKAALGLVAHINYEISLLDSTLCYSSSNLGVKAFKIGQGGVESGLEEAILLLSEGDSARFIMPPHLAYGLLGDENKIPPRSTIVYNVELIKLTDY